MEPGQFRKLRKRFFKHRNQLEGPFKQVIYFDAAPALNYIKDPCASRVIEAYTHQFPERNIRNFWMYGLHTWARDQICGELHERITQGLLNSEFAIINAHVLGPGIQEGYASHVFYGDLVTATPRMKAILIPRKKTDFPHEGYIRKTYLQKLSDEDRADLRELDTFFGNT